MKHLLTILLFSISTLAFGQSNAKKDAYEIRIPKNLTQAIKILDKTLSEKELEVVKTYPEDSIYYHDEFRNGTDFFHAWKLYDGSRITKYFNKLGLYGTREIYNTILVSYHRHLNKKPIHLDQQIKKYQEKQKADNEAYLARINKDSLNGVYIPKDLRDSFATLNKILSEKDIKEIKTLSSRNETIKYHHGLGMWLRNNWGLWSGSRLQKYMLDMGVDHPDSMSALVLELYYDWLHGEEEALVKFENK
ncbi:hypothetical protein D770_04890 [Flammeovirgaceae bacterium 311]|nr:hypothetical protein D770_04890 [Flammeovirgaceae bacterium 311]